MPVGKAPGLGMQIRKNRGVGLDSPLPDSSSARTGSRSRPFCRVQIKKRLHIGAVFKMNAVSLTYSTVASTSVKYSILAALRSSAMSDL